MLVCASGKRLAGTVMTPSSLTFFLVFLFLYRTDDLLHMPGSPVKSCCVNYPSALSVAIP